MQTPEGTVKMMQTIYKRYKYTPDGRSALHVRVGAIGGSAPHTTPRGFAARRDLASIAGAYGGCIGGRGNRHSSLTPAERAKYKAAFQKNYERLQSVHEKANHA